MENCTSQYTTFSPPVFSSSEASKRSTRMEQSFYEFLKNKEIQEFMPSSDFETSKITGAVSNIFYCFLLQRPTAVIKYLNGLTFTVFADQAKIEAVYENRCAKPHNRLHFLWENLHSETPDVHVSKFNHCLPNPIENPDSDFPSDSHAKMAVELNERVGEIFINDAVKRWISLDDLETFLVESALGEIFLSFFGNVLVEKTYTHTEDLNILVSLNNYDLNIYIYKAGHGLFLSVDKEFKIAYELIQKGPSYLLNDISTTLKQKLITGLLRKQNDLYPFKMYSLLMSIDQVCFMIYCASLGGMPKEERSENLFKKATFTVVPKENSVEAYVRRNTKKSSQAVRLVFSNADDQFDITIFSEVCTRRTIRHDPPVQIKSVMSYVRDLKEIRNIVPLDYSRVTYTEGKVSEIEVFSPKFTSDCHSFFELAEVSEEMLRKFLHQVSRALSGMHYPGDGKCGYVHKDLKLENIVVDYEVIGSQFKVKKFALIDFDMCAKIKKIKQISRCVGSYINVSPELVVSTRPAKFKKLIKKVGEFSLGPKMDTWALGVLLQTFFQERMPEPLKIIEELISHEFMLSKLSIQYENDEITKSEYEIKYQQLAGELENLIYNYGKSLHQFSMTPRPNNGTFLDEIIWRLLQVNPEKRLSSKELYEMTRKNKMKRKREASVREPEFSLDLTGSTEKEQKSIKV